VLWGDVAANNVRMLGLADGLGFRRRPRADDLSLFQVELGLR
jgi:hypothetical protein